MPSPEEQARQNIDALLGRCGWVIENHKLDTFRPDLRAAYVLANPPFNDSDTALSESAFVQSEANSQVVSKAKDNFRRDDDVRWQWSEATWTTNGSPKGEHNQARQFASPKRGNANFALLSIPHSDFRIRTLSCLAPHGMAGFVLLRFYSWAKLKAARVIKSSDRARPASFRQRRGGTFFLLNRDMREPMTSF